MTNTIVATIGSIARYRISRRANPRGSPEFHAEHAGKTLASSSYVAVRRIRADRTRDCVILIDVVASFYEKQLALECVR